MNHSPQRTALSLLGALVLWSGCMDPVRAEKWLFARAVRVVAEALVPGATVSRPHLKACGNLREDVLIYADGAPTTDGALLAWVRIKGKTYAVNSLTQRQTPSLPLLEHAPTEDIEQAGYTPGALEKGVRLSLFMRGVRPEQACAVGQPDACHPWAYVEVKGRRLSYGAFGVCCPPVPRGHHGRSHLRPAAF